MRNIYREVKWAWQRVVRGYDDRVFWGFDGYFMKIIPALEEFCTSYFAIDDGERAKMNPERAAIFSETIYLIQAYRQVEDTWSEGDEALSHLFGYVGKNIGYYWD